MQAQPYGTNDFAMMMPGGWERQAVVSFIGPEVDTVQQCIVLTQETMAENTPTDQFVDHQIAQLKEQLPKFVLKERSVIEVRGQEAPIALYQWKPKKSKEVSQVVVFYLRTLGG